MRSSEIIYKGISRALSNEDIADGQLDEAINVRHRNGRFTTRGEATKLYNLPSEQFTKIWLHDQDEMNNFIGYIQSSGQLKLINMTSGNSTLIHALPVGTSMEVTFIKRFMILTTSSQVITFFWNLEQSVYEEIKAPSQTPGIEIEPSIFNDLILVEFIETDPVTEVNALIGKYYKALNDMSKNAGKLNGYASFRVAFRMFDGSYVLHTVPKITTISSYVKIIRTSSGYKWKIGFVNIRAKINPATFAGINSNIYTHAVIFMSKVEPRPEITEDTIESAIEGLLINGETILSNVENSDEYNNLTDAPAWYNVIELKIEDIQSQAAEYTKEIKTKGFYQDYATREAMTVDQFSHHKIAGTVSYAYNDRLMLADIKTEFANYFHRLWYVSGSISGSTPRPFNGVNYNDRTISLIYTINTQQGKIKVISTMENQFVARRSDGVYLFRFPPAIGYPDARASNIRVIYHRPMAVGDPQLVEVGNFGLTPSKTDNFAYFKMMGEDEDSGTSAYISNYLEMPEGEFDNHVTTLDSTVNNYIDSNRVQLSESQNPLFFPAKNSYQVGTGRVLGLAANTEPISQGQYGEYPLNVFTTKGIWTMAQGAGDVVFASIQPLNGEVVGNKENIVPLSVGVAYTNDRGLFLIRGQEVTDLSQVLIGRPNIDLQQVELFQLTLDLPNMVQLVTSLSTVDAKLYIQNAKIGFDKQNNEILVTNPEYSYSYVFSLDSNSWHKISESYRLLINAYPELLCTRENSTNNGVFTVSREQFVNSKQVLVTTRPCKLESGNGLSLLNRIIQRCEIDTKDNTYSGFYVYGSNDLQRWTFLAGNDRRIGKVTDIMLSRAFSKAKYFVFVFASDLMPGGAINSVEVQHTPKMYGKIR